ncbi:hypothetical protein ACH5RR_014245 [Cinchona calisaya]|uniref:C2H2-type domain-containing protein n=1 Tax=Cinchona calisaya TaxID=153742 RepID=A0ABD3A860_9GENT
MEENQEKKFVCKFCNKCCFSGKSLGGHMRCHLALISAAKKEKAKAEIHMGFEEGDDQNHDHGDYELKKNHKNFSRVSGEQSNSCLIQEKAEDHSNSCIMNLENDDQDQDNYGLRRNPKKSWKIPDLRPCRAPEKGNLCKDCCKNFPSSRALAGHMRTHSGRFRDRHICKKCGKGFDSIRAMYGHMKSHSKGLKVSSESSDGLSDFDIVYPRKKRSVVRYKFSQDFSFSTANASSYGNEVDDLQNAAMCLIMLSKGMRNWDGVNSPLEYTDNAASVDFKAKSIYLPEEGVVKMDADDSVCNLDEVDKSEKPIEELDSCFSGSENSQSKQNVSQLNVLGSELEVCVDEPVCESKRIELDDSMIKRASDSAGVVELLKDQTELAGIGIGMGNAHDPELEGSSSDVAKCDGTPEIFKDSEKNREYKCRTCNMIFSSHQALGGHRNRHKVHGHCSALSSETSPLTDLDCNDTSTEAGSSGLLLADFELVKSKDHQCQKCLKVFSSGQALGGHKRAHYVGVSESRMKEMTTVGNQELHDIQDVFHLNLPVITRPGAKDDGVSHKVWWAARGHEPEPLVISN